VYVYSLQEDTSRVGRREKPGAIRIENAIPVVIDKALFQEVQADHGRTHSDGEKGRVSVQRPGILQLWREDARAEITAQGV